FQFFSGMNLFLWYYSDLEGAVKDRLYSTPTSRASFIFGKALGSIAFSLIQGIVVIVVTWAFFDANWGNPIILILTLLTISIISHLVSAITYILSKSKSQANAIGYIYSFGLMIISGTFLVNFSILGLQDNPVVRFLETRGTPISLGWRAIQYSGPILDDMSEAIFNVGLLAGIMVVLAIIVAILAKRRRSA
ncbi:MAG: ABC transporter permease, partial [Defluviitaleaceae bacterium]|nr:ABC transporter permease [Defluviitaleaceae bacterium]